MTRRGGGWPSRRASPPQSAPVRPSPPQPAPVRRVRPHQVYIPLPCAEARGAIVERTLASAGACSHSLSAADLAKARTDTPRRRQSSGRTRRADGRTRVRTHGPPRTPNGPRCVTGRRVTAAAT